jgi:8-oxo-dGTP pyrophosphatase MutT (NUDIX family)
MLTLAKPRSAFRPFASNASELSTQDYKTQDSFMLDDFINELKHSLEKPLPGIDAQFIMAPAGRKELYPDLTTLKGHRESAVCLFLFVENGKLFFPLMERATYVGVHSGQISLPGGKIEKDEDYITSALREMHEEIGVTCPKENVIGKLTDIYIPPSNFLVKPVVAWSEKKPEFILNAYEVQSLILFGVGELLNETMMKETVIETSTGLKLKTPYFDVQGKILWGATAMILSEFKTLLKSESFNAFSPFL